MGETFLIKHLSLHNFDDETLHVQITNLRTTPKSSTWADIETGVSQGGIVSPIMFSLFINSIIHFSTEVRDQINKMLEQNIIRPSDSAWSSPIWIVPKKADASGKIKWRLVVDFRKVNEKTVDDKYPIPNITDVLDKLGKCQTLLVLHLLLGPALMQEIRLESLSDGPGILPFKLGPARILSHYHAFLQYVNLQELGDKVNSVKTQLISISPNLNNITNSLFQPHIDYLKNKLESVTIQLSSFKTNREKRGLVDGLGSIIKSITGNLDYTDADHFNRAIKSIHEDENKIVTEFNNHVSLTKDLSNQYSRIIDSIVDNQNKLEILIGKINQSEATRDYDLIKYAHFGQVLMILSDNVDSISQELIKLQNNLAFIRANTMHHSIVNLKSIRIMINRATELYGNKKVGDLDIREYYDIIRLGSYYVGNEIVIVFKFPILLPHIYDMYKLSIVPNKRHEILTPPFPFLAIYQKDFQYIEAECPKTSKWYICKEKRSLRSQTSPDCIHHLITKQQTNAVCNPYTVTLDKPAYEELDDKHYTITFPTPTKVHLSCGQDLYKILQGSYLVIVPLKCYIETPLFSISNTKDRLKGQALKIMDIPEEHTSIPSSASAYKLNSINLQHLHATNTKISQQSPLNLRRNDDYSLYHTTIPFYALIISAGALILCILYRRYKPKPTGGTQRNSEEDHPKSLRVYAVPDTEKIDLDQLPAQFTTKVFHSRCSSGGGVTQP
ncbi:unnamed protein product [Parnassius mnemosyne]|uniref:Envelope protein n=1 Tax=Parnassius mnemosyne TaxID=213953 RepID=A0AAV1M251_9NEOP